MAAQRTTTPTPIPAHPDAKLIEACGRIATIEGEMHARCDEASAADGDANFDAIVSEAMAEQAGPIEGVLRQPASTAAGVVAQLRMLATLNPVQGNGSRAFPFVHGGRLATLLDKVLADAAALEGDAA